MAATFKVKPQPDGTVRLSGTGTLDEMFHLVRSVAADYAITKPLLTSPNLVKSYLHTMLGRKSHEEFWALFLDTKNNLLAAECMFTGTLDSCAVYPREVLKRALALNAAHVVFAHNHPSGSPEPSRADRTITERLKAALALVDVRVLDHIVVGEGECVSLAERGWV